MGSIPGYYEWDDDDLTPSKKKEGGLHQNLFDADGNLKGNARFIPADLIPADQVDPDPAHATEYVTERVYVPAEERRLTPEQQELADLIGDIVFAFLVIGIDRARPHVKRWYEESVRPFVSRQRARLSKRRQKDVAEADRGPSSAALSSEASIQTSSEVAVAVPRPKMSSAEAQARYLAAMAARAFSEEQLRLVKSADIIDAEGVAAIEARLAELPRDDVLELMSRMIKDPSMLSEDTLAGLASALARIGPPDQGGFRQLPRDPD